MINSTACYNDFWNEVREAQEVLDRLRDGRESKNNAYHLPGESNKKYMAALQKESVVRQLTTVVNATRSDSRLWTFDCEGQAEWGDRVNLEGMDNGDDFQRFEVQAYRLSELVRLGMEFASDQSFAIEDYVIGKWHAVLAQARNRRLLTEQGEISRQAFCTLLMGQKRASRQRVILPSAMTKSSNCICPWIRNTVNMVHGL